MTQRLVSSLKAALRPHSTAVSERVHFARRSLDANYNSIKMGSVVVDEDGASKPLRPNGEIRPGLGGGSQESFGMKKAIGLWNGVTIIMGVVIGSGIFVSPRGVLEEAGSLGMALTVWALSGTLSTVGALCYSELGTMIPKSGGDYAYIFEAFGPLPAFLVLWVNLVIITPTSNAIAGITFANYLLGPMYTNCVPPANAVRLIAAFIICFLTFVNCYNVKWATKVQDIFTFTKVLALVIVIVTGIVWLFLGHTEHFSQPFHKSTTDPGQIALAFYSGLFSYAGWNYLNFVTEELKNPYKNLPRAIYISMPTVTVIYILANVAYFAVLTVPEIMSSNAVAVTFGERTLGYFSWVMPISVAMSTFGSLNGNIFASSRLFFVGAREGHLPEGLAMIHLNWRTPIPSLIFVCIVSIMYLTTTQVFVLINYVAFSESLFVSFSAAALIWFRIKQPNRHRPIKVNIMLPVTFFLVSLFLVFLPFYTNIWETGVGVLITLSAVPVYFLTIYWKRKPQVYRKIIGFTTKLIQKFTLTVQTEVNTHKG